MSDTELDVVLASLAGVFDGDEPVDELSHALQCALHAHDAGADGQLVAAALLHDVARSPLIRGLDPSLPHEIAGAMWLRPRYGERVAWLVEAHTVAKVYLTETEPGYGDSLSSESRKSAQVQRAMPRDPYVGHRWWSDALRLRRWDDASKERDFQLPDVRGILAVVRGLRVD